MGLKDWITFTDPMANPYYPYGDTYNIGYDICYKLWEILGGFLAWLVNLLLPGNGLSEFLVSDEVVNAFAIILFAVVVFMVIFIGVLISLWQERKFLGRFMDRRGTMIGMKGFMQCVADGFKTFMKENVIPRKVDKMAYMWTLSLVIGTSVMVATMLPLSDRFFIVNYDSGLLIVMAIYALAPSLSLFRMGPEQQIFAYRGMRAAQSMIAYEIPMLIVVCSVALLAGSFNIGNRGGPERNHMVHHPLALGFIVFFTCSLAESERSPSDLAEAESELVEGWQTEYAGMKWGLIMLGDYLRGFASCAMASIMFLGGWNIAPFLSDEVNGFLPNSCSCSKDGSCSA